MSVLVAAGVAGFGLYAVAFASVQIGRLDGNGIVYTMANVAAAALVLVSMVEQFNLGSLLTQVTWIAVGIVGLIRRRGERALAGGTPTLEPVLDSVVSATNA